MSGITIKDLPMAEGINDDDFLILEKYNGTKKIKARNFKGFLGDDSNIEIWDKTLAEILSQQSDALKKHENELVNQSKRIEANEKEVSLKVSEDVFEERLGELGNNISYRVEVISTDGEIFNNGDIRTTLKAKVYKGKTDVTLLFSNEQFKWKRVSRDIEDDKAWNVVHENIGNEVNITHLDVDNRATFFVEILDETGSKIN